jgi:hypothetical protein
MLIGSEWVRDISLMHIWKRPVKLFAGNFWRVTMNLKPVTELLLCTGSSHKTCMERNGPIIWNAVAGRSNIVGIRKIILIVP